MAAEHDDKDSAQIDLQYYWELARRRHMYFLIPLFFGWLAVWGASWILPPRYRSSTLILVEQPTMPKDYVTPNVTDDLQERLQSITQQILSRTRLLHIIDERRLYAESRTALTPDDKVERMRKDIDIEVVRDPQNRVNAFNVYYSARNPRIAQMVTSELTDLFISENLEVRQRQSEDTTNFLENQLETTRATLSSQEEKIREFKGAHVGELPAQLSSNLEILSGMQSQLQSEEDALNNAKQQHVYLQSLVDQYRNLKTSSPADAASSGLPAVDQELEHLRAQLADLTSHYTERHPDVRKLRDQITKTQRIRDQMARDLQNGGVSGPSQTSALAQLQSQLQSNGVEIANRDNSVADLKAKISQYQSRLNKEPVREQELADLTRGYDQLKANYDDLLKKKNESAMATSMELLQQGERFRVLDPPSLPAKPDFPNRIKFCVIGFGFGLGLGLLVAALFEASDDRIYSEEAFKALLPVAVICEIPVITSPGVVAQDRIAWSRWVTTALILMIMLAGSLFSYLHA